MKTHHLPSRIVALRRSGFTLIEILTAVTVLTLMLLMVNQLVSSAAAVMSASGKHLDADTQARLIFNRMAVDFSGMMKRTDVDYSTFKNAMTSNAQDGTDTGNTSHNDQLAFYSETHGYFSGTIQPAGTSKADLSLVAYMVAPVDSNGSLDTAAGTPVLQRLGKGLGWEPDTSGAGAWSNVAYLPATLVSGSNARWPSLFTTTTALDPDYRSVGDLVFRMEYTYLLKPTSTAPATLSITPFYNTSGHTTVNGFKDVAAIVVTIAMLDNSSRLLVKNYANLISGSATTFPDAVNGATPAAAWNANVNSATFTTAAGIPKTAASAVHVYERYFYLNSSP